MTGSINLITVAIIFCAGLIAIGLTAWMLNRAWGNFPTRLGPRAEPPQLPPSPWQAPAGLDAGDDDEGDERLPAGAPAEGLVPVTHPLVLRAVQQAMERPGSPYATYFIQDGERVYLALYRIADPSERETARRLFEGLNSKSPGNVDFADMMRVFNQLMRK